MKASTKRIRSRRRAGAIFIFGLLLCALSGEASAQGWEGADYIDAGAGQDARNPSIACDHDGNCVVVFQQDDGTSDRIYAVRYESGPGWGTPSIIDAGLGYDAEYPDIAVASNGDAIALFLESNGSIKRLYANHYDTASGSWSAPSTIDAGTGFGVAELKIAVNSTGEGVAVFRQSDGSHYRIYANRYDPGFGWHGATIIDAATGYNALFTNVALDDDGNVIAVFRQYDGSYNRIYANTYDAAAASWNGAATIDLELMPANIDRLIASSDYDGDGITDIAVFRPATSLWAVRGVTRIYYGRAGDEPAPADYTGDGSTGAGIFRPSTGLWSLRGLTRIYFGDFGDIPLPGDFNGDGTAEVAIFRGSSGLWSIRGVTRNYFGAQDDQPIPADYAGVGLPDIAVFRASKQLWALQGLSRLYFGAPTDTLVPADFSGDGTVTPAVFRLGVGLWAIRDLSRLYFGSSADRPLPADLNADGFADALIFRSSSGLWAARGVTRLYFGTGGDIPMSR